MSKIKVSAMMGDMTEEQRQKIREEAEYEKWEPEGYDNIKIEEGTWKLGPNDEWSLYCDGVRVEGDILALLEATRDNIELFSDFITLELDDGWTKSNEEELNDRKEIYYYNYEEEIRVKEIIEDNDDYFVTRDELEIIEYDEGGLVSEMI
jgi:hypothetical protein